MLKSVSSITNAIGALNFKGTWDANANSPPLASSVGTKGDYYVVGTAGSTNLNGISNWGVGDLATFNGSVWQRVEGGADLNGVNLSVSGTSTLSGLTASTALALNASKEIVSVTNTGTGDNVLATSPTMITPTLGVAVATSINKVALTAPATGSTLTIADGKTLTANQSLTLAGTDATTMTFPSTNATIARIDAAQTFTGDQTFAGINISSIVNGIGKTGTFTRITNAASGNVSYTGVGFKPSAIILIGGIDTVNEKCWGFGTAAAGRNLYSDSSNANTSSANIFRFVRLAETQSAIVASMDSDGFTLTWTFSGAGVTANAIVVNYIAFK